MTERYIGLMSGTSMDGVDGVLAEFAAAGGPLRVLHHATAPFPAELKSEFMALNTSGPDELHRAALAGNALARCYAAVVRSLLQAGGMDAAAVRAIGAHGQTVRHQPGREDGVGYTVQINSPALLAELTGIDVVADLRSRDLAAGGQGAPLVPAFHREMFGQPGQTVCVLNIGGIANLSVLDRTGGVSGFDCGPGNALMDHWCDRHQGRPYDADGAWAGGGQIDSALLALLLAEPYFKSAPPKSTGRDLFNPTWLQARLSGFARVAPVDVQATLCELTAASCARDVQVHGPGARLLIVCGGGSRNGHLMRRLRALLPGVTVSASDDHGLPALQVEAAAFAWLARKAVRRETASLPSVTGARGARVLGAVYPAGPSAGA